MTSNSRNVDRAVNINDLRRLARRYLPRIMFDYIEGGVDDEIGLVRNAQAFDKIEFLPRYYRDTSARHQAASLLGRRYASPFGISPTGLAGILRHGTDGYLAEAAAQADIPFILSGASNLTVEQTEPHVRGHLWFQIYGTRDRSIVFDLIRRAEASGIHTLVVTCDVPISSNRERNRRNGFSRPPQLTLPTILESLLHPAWVAGFIKNGGMPALATWQAYAPPGADANAVAGVFAKQTPDPSQTWSDLSDIRKAWPGKLVVKGILHPDDARKTVDLGVDALIVSNHGARQIDLSPSPLAVLPAIRKAVGPSIPLIVDGGITRGSHVVAALCLGANFVLTGRATLYGATAGGRAGAAKAISILQREIDLTLGQLGAANVTELGAEFLMSSPSFEGASAKPF